MVPGPPTFDVVRVVVKCNPDASNILSVLVEVPERSSLCSLPELSPEIFYLCCEELVSSRWRLQEFPRLELAVYLASITSSITSAIPRRSRRNISSFSRSSRTVSIWRAATRWHRNYSQAWLRTCHNASAEALAKNMPAPRQ